MFSEARLLERVARRVREYVEAASPWEPIWRSHGDSWEQAIARGRYSDRHILDEVRDATRAVTTGHAAYARDGVTFDAIQYSWPVLATLLKAATDAGRPIHVVDFGGGLGTSYHQNKAFAGSAIGSWHIVEQPAFVDCGNAEFADATLRFFHSLGEAVANQPPDLVLASCVLQYLAEPYATLNALCDLHAPTVVLDLLAVTGDPADRLTLQHLPTGTGWQPAYPTWFFSAAQFVARIPEDYQVLAQFNGYIGDRLWVDDQPKGRYIGLILQRAESAPSKGL
jgi:putative methyltransferase (TIGR04325 family)